jgi:hypothetical protein
MSRPTTHDIPIIKRMQLGEAVRGKYFQQYTKRPVSPLPALASIAQKRNHLPR